ncbi:GGDEF domain-containing protein, partial [Mycobacterium sp. ITM-2017-0098]
TDQFDWFSNYLRERGMQPQWRWATFSFTVLLATLPVIMLSSPLGPGSALTSGIAVAAAAGGFGASLLWLFRWPTRVQSLMFNFLC